MPNIFNSPADSLERRRKPNDALFAECVERRIAPRVLLSPRTKQGILVEFPDIIRRMEATPATHDQLARPALQEVMAAPEVTDSPSGFPVVSSEDAVANTAQSHDSVAFLSDARARVDAHYQSDTPVPDDTVGTTTEMRIYLEQHPRVSQNQYDTSFGKTSSQPTGIYPVIDTPAEPAAFYSQSDVYQVTQSQQQNPLFQNPNQTTSPIEENLEAIGYRDVA